MAFDSTIDIVLDIQDSDSEFTLVQVDIPYLDKSIEVKVPNDIQVGHKMRIKNLGYLDDASGIRGDLYLNISKIMKKGEAQVMQKIIVVEENDFDEVNEYLERGWKVKEFKPFRNDIYLYVYVLLER